MGLPSVKEERQAGRVAETGSESRVELRAVTKTFGPVRALVGVTVAFMAGRVSMVVGPNGSGKSTLLSILGTLTRPTSGKVSHGSLGRSREELRTVLGWVGHDSLCYGDLTGRENIELAARLHGVPARPAFESARERFELGSFAERPFRTYSRGQRQRVALARALVHAPLLRLLDEPTTGLDAKSVEALRAVLRAEAARGSVVVVITHDEGFASAAGDVRVALDRGRIRDVVAE